MGKIPEMSFKLLVGLKTFEQVASKADMSFKFCIKTGMFSMYVFWLCESSMCRILAVAVLTSTHNLCFEVI